MNSHTRNIHIRSIRKMVLFPAVLLLMLLLISLVPGAAHTAHAKVRLNKTSLDMVKGMTFQLKLKGTSANVKWKS